MSVEDLIKGGYILSDRQWLSVSNCLFFLMRLCAHSQYSAHPISRVYSWCARHGRCNTASPAESAPHEERFGLDPYPTRGGRERADASDVRILFLCHAWLDSGSCVLILTFTMCRTFMTVKKPSLWFRLIVLGAQGIFYNAFCTYSPLERMLQ